MRERVICYSVAATVAGWAFFASLDGLEVLGFHRGMGEGGDGDGDAEKIFERLAAADAGALGKVFELVEEKLAGGVLDRLAGQRAAENDVGQRTTVSYIDQGDRGALVRQLRSIAAH